MKIIFRILALPFFAVFVGIAFIKQLIIHCFNFLKYGGEGITYTEKHNSKTIMNVYEAVINKDLENGKE